LFNYFGITLLDSTQHFFPQDKFRIIVQSSYKASQSE